MGTTNIPILRVKTTYTLEEACEYMRMNNDWGMNWVNSDSGSPVSIGCTSG